MKIVVCGILIAVAIVSVGLVGLWFHCLVEREQKREIRYGRLVQDALDDGDEERADMLREQWQTGRLGCDNASTNVPESW